MLFILNKFSHVEFMSQAFVVRRMLRFNISIEPLQVLLLQA